MDRTQKIRILQAGTAAGIVVIGIIIFLLFSQLGVRTPPTTGPTPPSVTTEAATAVNASGATLNADLGSLGSASSVTVGFLYGTAADLSGPSNVTAGAENAVGSVSKAILGLAPNTTYYVRAWADGQGFASGSIVSFRTLVSPAIAAPSVTTENATSIGTTTATLNGNLGSLGTASNVTVGFLSGTSPNLSGATNTSVGTRIAAGGFSQTISGLSPSTAYYVRAWAKGNGFAAGAIVKFTTASPGNGHIVPRGWEHASCPALPSGATGHGEVARCTYNMTYGERKKLGLAGTVSQASTASLASAASIPVGIASIGLRRLDDLPKIDAIR